MVQGHTLGIWKLPSWDAYDVKLVGTHSVFLERNRKRTLPRTRYDVYYAWKMRILNTHVKKRQIGVGVGMAIRVINVYQFSMLHGWSWDKANPPHRWTSGGGWSIISALTLLVDLHSGSPGVDIYRRIPILRKGVDHGCSTRGRLMPI